MSTDKRKKKSDKSVKRTLKKIKLLYEEGDYYQAEQLLKTFHKRLNSQNKFEQSSKLLIEGATILFQHGKGAAGSSVCVDLLDTWKVEGKTPDAENIKIMCSLFEQFPENGFESQQRLLRAILNWIKDSEKDCDAPELNTMMNTCAAKVYLKKGNYSESSKYHLRAGGLTQSHANLIQKWSASSSALEKDFFIVRVILQYLCLRNPKDACAFMKHFPHLNDKNATPCANFLRFFLTAVLMKKSVALYQHVIKNYDPLIKADSDFANWIQFIGQIYLDLPAPQKAGGLLGNLMGMLNG